MQLISSQVTLSAKEMGGPEYFEPGPTPLNAKGKGGDLDDVKGASAYGGKKGGYAGEKGYAEYAPVYAPKGKGKGKNAVLVLLRTEHVRLNG